MSYAETFTALNDHLRLWARTTSFGEYVPRELQSATGYRSDSTDTRVADAICDLWQDELLADATTSKRQLAKRAGVTPNTAMAALRRLAGWFAHVAEAEDEDTGAGLLRLRWGDVAAALLTERYNAMRAGEIPVSPTLTTPLQSAAMGGQSAPNENPPLETNEYSGRKTDDAWLSGTSPTVKRWASDLSADAEMTPREWVQEYTHAGLGETKLRICDALARCGDMTAQELVEETGKTLGSIRRAVRGLETLGVVDAERESARAPKVYSLPDDWSARVDDLRPTLRTYQLGDWREERRLYEALCWQHRRCPNPDALPDEEDRKAARRRRAKLETQRAAVLQRLYPNLDAAEVWRMAVDVNVRH